MIASRLRLRLVWLTLFAFSVQIAVADFHHHTALGTGHGTGIQARAMTPGMCVPLHAHPCGPLQKDHDGCVLCWATAIAATSLTPSLFNLPAPSKLIEIELRAFDTVQFQLVRYDEFRARGPPKTSFI
jgi:hypothetical protein